MTSMRIRELLVQVAKRAKGRLSFEELDEVSIDEEWAARERATDAADPVSAAINRFLDDALFAPVVPFCATWAEHGFPRVAVGTRLAASLMASSLDTRGERLELPWNALLVQLPDGLVFGAGKSGAREAMRLVLAFRFQTGETGVRVLSDAGTAWAIPSRPLEDALDDDGMTQGVGPAVPTLERRSLLLVRRVVQGVAAGLSSGARERLRPSRPSLDGADKKPQRMLSVGLPRELRSDCREAIQSYLFEDPRNAAAARAILRGAWRRHEGDDADEWSWVQPQIGVVRESPTSVKMRVLKSV